MSSQNNFAGHRVNPLIERSPARNSQGFIRIADGEDYQRWYKRSFLLSKKELDYCSSRELHDELCIETEKLTLHEIEILLADESARIAFVVAIRLSMSI